MTSEEKKRYFEEVAIQLRRQGFVTLSPEDDMMVVKWGQSRLCQVTPSGGVSYRGADMKDSFIEEARNRVYAVARTVAEYMTLMEQAPQLKASGLEGDYRALAEFNGVVLAGHPTRFGTEFVTWEWVQQRTGLWQGHYYGDNYTAAKQDFATRSGLLPGERILSDQQLAEVYRYIHETMESDYPLTREREQILTNTAAQIERVVPKLEKLVQKSNEREMLQGQTMDDPGMM